MSVMRQNVCFRPIADIVFPAKHPRMGAASRYQIWATALHRAALVPGFLIAMMGFAACMNFGFAAVRLTSPLVWFGFLAMFNPFFSLGVRHLYRATFDNPKNLMLLGVATGAFTGLFVGVMLIITS